MENFPARPVDCYKPEPATRDQLEQLKDDVYELRKQLNRIEKLLQALKPA